MDGISRRYAQQCWSLISGELADVMAPHGEGSVLADDLLLLRSPRDPAPARLVPAYDPLLSTRDRWSLLPERAHQQAVWRAAANPGVVLSRDRIVGTWRARKKRDQLQFTVTTFDGYTVDSALLEDDAHAIAVARGADEATLTRERPCPRIHFGDP